MMIREELGFRYVLDTQKFYSADDIRADLPRCATLDDCIAQHVRKGKEVRGKDVRDFLRRQGYCTSLEIAQRCLASNAAVLLRIQQDPDPVITVRNRGLNSYLIAPEDVDRYTVRSHHAYFNDMDDRLMNVDPDKAYAKFGLAHALDINPKCVDGFISEGLPVEKVGREYRIDGKDAIAFLRMRVRMFTIRETGMRLGFPDQFIRQFVKEGTVRTHYLGKRGYPFISADDFPQLELALRRHVLRVSPSTVIRTEQDIRDYVALLIEDKVEMGARQIAAASQGFAKILVDHYGSYWKARARLRTYFLGIDRPDLAAACSNAEVKKRKSERLRALQRRVRRQRKEAGEKRKEARLAAAANELRRISSHSGELITRGMLMADHPGLFARISEDYGSVYEFAKKAGVPTDIPGHRRTVQSITDDLVRIASKGYDVRARSLFQTHHALHNAAGRHPMIGSVGNALAIARKKAVGDPVALARIDAALDHCWGYSGELDMRAAERKFKHHSERLSRVRKLREFSHLVVDRDHTRGIDLLDALLEYYSEETPIIETLMQIRVVAGLTLTHFGSLESAVESMSLLLQREGQPELAAEIAVRYYEDKMNRRLWKRRILGDDL